MRLKFLLLPFTAALLSSCAFQGVVVQKDLEPQPLYLSQGIEGRYTFILQDKAGVRRRQLVTPDVYERYAVGQYFNDQETGPAGRSDDSKIVQTPTMTASRSLATSTARLASRTAVAPMKIAAPKSKSKTTRHLAAKPLVHRKTSVAAKRKTRQSIKPVMTVASTTPVTAPAQSIPETDASFRVVNVSRVR